MPPDLIESAPPPAGQDWLGRLAITPALSWTVVAVVFGLTTAATALGSPRLFIERPLETALALAAANAALFGTLALIEQLWSPASQRARRIARLPVLGFAGAVRGMVLGLTLSWLGAETVVNWPLRVGGSVLVTSISFAIGLLVSASVREHRQRVGQLVADQARLRQARHEVEQGIGERHRRAVAEVKDLLLDELGSAFQRAPEVAVAELRHAIDRVIRPLSADLASPELRSALLPEPEPVTAGGWSELLADATTGRPLRLGGIWLATSVISAIWAVTTLPVAAAAWLVLAGPAILVGVCALANLALERITPFLGPAARVVCLSAALLAIGTSLGLVAWVQFQPHPAAVSILLGDIILVPALGWLFAIAGAARQQQQRLEGQLRELSRHLEWELARVRELEWQQRRSLSRALHGPVQGAVGRAVLRLERALAAGQPTESLLTELHGQVQEAISGVDGVAARAGAATVLAEIAETYRGVCAVAATISDAALVRLEQDEICGAALAEIVNEAVWNAVRHGEASQVWVVIDLPDEHTVRLQVENNGGEPAEAGRRGLGSGLLDDVAITWTRERVGQITRLTAVLPSAPTPG